MQPARAVFRIAFDLDNNNNICGAFQFPPTAIVIDDGVKSKAKKAAVKALKNNFNITVSESDIELDWPKNVTMVEDFRDLVYKERHVKIVFTSDEKKKEFSGRLKHVVPESRSVDVDPPFAFTFAIPTTPTRSSEHIASTIDTELTTDTAVSELRSELKKEHEDFIKKIEEKYQQRLEEQETRHSQLREEYKKIEEKHQQRLEEQETLQEQSAEEHAKFVEELQSKNAKYSEKLENLIEKLAVADRRASRICFRILVSEARRRAIAAIGDRNATWRQINDELSLRLSPGSITYMSTLGDRGNVAAHQADMGTIENFICRIDGQNRIHLEELFEYVFGRRPAL